MKTYVLCVLAGLMLVAPSLVAQTNGAARPAIPEEARKHFVMGETMFKESKNEQNFSQAITEFNEAVRLAPQWPEARYNLALAKEAAGDYPGAMTDLKLYQQFKLSDTEARTVQDKIYAIEAKQKLQAVNTEADALAKRWEQDIREARAAQASFPELMNKLRGAIFAIPDGHAFYFLMRPIHNADFTVYGGLSAAATEAYDATPYLRCEYSSIDKGQRFFSAPGGVIPTSNSEVHVPGYSCGDFAITPDGQYLIQRDDNGRLVYYRKQ